MIDTPFLVAELSSQFEYSPISGTLPEVPRSDTLSHSRSLQPVKPDSSATSPAHAVSLARERSRSPTNVRRRSSISSGFKPEELRFIRLIPHSNPHRIFKIRRYTFPADVSIYLKGNNNAPIAIATRGQAVLSTSSGDIMAILERNNTLLRGIFQYDIASKREKMNMFSGAISEMTKYEIRDIPLGRKHVI